MDVILKYPLIIPGLDHVHRITSSMDAALFRLINGIPHAAWLNLLMTLATLYGLGVVQSGIALALILVGVVADKKHLRQAGSAGLIALLMSLVAVAVTKNLWDRPRPLLQLFDVHLVNEQLFTRSFPSGHSSTAFAAAIAFAAFLPRARYLLIGAACIVAFSRVYLGVHFPLDTFYGALMGSLLGMAAARITRVFSSNNTKTTEMKGEDASQAEM